MSYEVVVIGGQGARWFKASDIRRIMQLKNLWSPRGYIVDWRVTK